MSMALRKLNGSFSPFRKFAIELKINHFAGEHQPLFQLNSLFPECASYFKFAFVRSPWERMISSYFLKKRQPHNFPGEQYADFDDYIHTVLAGPTWKKFPADNIPQVAYLTPNGSLNMSLGVDFVGRFENLANDYDELQKRIGIHLPPMPHINKTNHKDYKEYYTKESKELVKKCFAADVDYFDYVFSIKL